MNICVAGDVHGRINKFHKSVKDLFYIPNGTAVKIKIKTGNGAERITESLTPIDKILKI